MFVYLKACTHAFNKVRCTRWEQLQTLTLWKLVKGWNAGFHKGSHKHLENLLNFCMHLFECCKLTKMLYRNSRHAWKVSCFVALGLGRIYVQNLYHYLFPPALFHGWHKLFAYHQLIKFAEIFGYMTSRCKHGHLHDIWKCVFWHEKKKRMHTIPYGGLRCKCLVV